MLQVTKQIIQTVDRKLLQLESKLTINTIESYSTNIQAEILQPVYDLENVEKNILNDVKTESDIKIDVLKSEIGVKFGPTNIGIDSFTTIEPCGQQIDEISNVCFYNDFNDSNETELIADIPKSRKKRTPQTTQNNRNVRKLKNATSARSIKTRRKVSEVLSNKTKIQLFNETVKSNEDNSLINDVSKTDKRESKRDKNDKDTEEKPRNKSGPKFNESYFKDYAKVVLLTPEEAMKEVLLRKESSNYKNCSFKCEFCFRGFETEITFDKHMKKHSPVSFSIIIIGSQNYVSTTYVITLLGIHSYHNSVLWMLLKRIIILLPLTPLFIIHLSPFIYIAHSLNLFFSLLLFK